MKEYKPCAACGSTRVERATVPAIDEAKELVTVTCAGCGNQRASYYRRRRKETR